MESRVLNACRIDKDYRAYGLANQRVLFSTYSLRCALEEYGRIMQAEIDNYDPNRLLNTSVEDLCAYFEETYRVDGPQLREDEAVADYGEARVDISRDSDRAVIDRSRPVHTAGLRVTYEIPFEGNGDLFLCQANTRSMAGPPSAHVDGQSLILEHVTASPDPQAIKASLGRELGTIRTHLGWVNADISAFNSSLRETARARINERRARLLRDQGVAAALGIPLKRRDNVPQTFSVPEVRRKVRPAPPPASTAPFVPEPALDMTEYEHILKVVGSMANVLERSPKAFEHMQEEQLRDHFLVQLNGHYEGQATGETFNYDGKTDILIRNSGRNIFIGECKFWKGQKKFLGTIDQLLDYATWRDTRTAIIVFNRQRNFSTVLEGIAESLPTHSNVKRMIGRPSETEFRCVLASRDDPNREMILTVLAFDVPGATEKIRADS